MAQASTAAKEWMTVRQAMEALNARAPQTIHRMIERKELRGEQMGSMGWLVHRDSVRAMQERDAASKPRGGYPRGKSRTQATSAAKPRAKARRKATRR